MTWSIRKKFCYSNWDFDTNSTQRCKRQVKNYKRDSNAVFSSLKIASYILPILNFNLFIPWQQIIRSVILVKGNERIFYFRIKKSYSCWSEKIEVGEWLFFCILPPWNSEDFLVFFQLPGGPILFCHPFHLFSRRKKRLFKMMKNSRSFLFINGTR